MAQKLSKLFVAFLFLPFGVSAQVVISEIMYDLAEGGDTGREWVEVQNTGSESVNLTEWKLFENDTNHGLKAMGGESLTPGSYAIISDNPAKFAADWPSYSGLVFDSAFALNNSGETLVLRCCGKEPIDRDSVTYNNTGGGSGDGLSLHRSGSSLAAAQPSPGSGAVKAPPPPAPEPEPKSDPAPAPIVQPKAPDPVVQKKQEPAPTKTTQAEPAIETKVTQQAEPVPPPTIVIQEEKPVAPKTKKKTVVVDAEEIVESESEELVTVTSQPTPVSQAAAVQSSGAPSDLLWWLGAAAVSIFGAGGAYVAGRTQRAPKMLRTKDGWQIEESE